MSLPRLSIRGAEGERHRKNAFNVLSVLLLKSSPGVYKHERNLAAWHLNGWKYDI